MGATRWNWSRSTRRAWKRPPIGATWARPRPTSATSVRRASCRPAASCGTSRTSTRCPRGQPTVLNAFKGRITNRFHARDLHLVMGAKAPGSRVRFRVLLDGHAPGSARGVDVDGDGNGVAIEPRLYQLIRQTAPIVDHTFEIEFLDAGVEVFSFTFG